VRVIVRYSSAADVTKQAERDDDEFVTFDDDISVKIHPSTIASALHRFTGASTCFKLFLVYNISLNLVML